MSLVLVARVKNTNIAVVKSVKLSGVDAIHVAVAVIRRGQEIFIARRPQHVHQGGRWEFPGGKIEVGESVEEALQRELDEELGVGFDQSRPLIVLHHDYPERKVVLHVRVVEGLSADPYGREGQETRWVPIGELHRYTFPEANVPIIDAISLPVLWMISPDPALLFNSDSFDARGENKPTASLSGYLAHIEAAFKSQCPGAFTFRAKSLDDHVYGIWLEPLAALCDRYNVKCFVHDRLDLADHQNVAGVHLSSRQALTLQSQIDKITATLVVSCHNAEEIKIAESIDARAIFLSPVQLTASHPDQEALGWQAFQSLTENSKMPVYALGGLDLSDLEFACEHGAQGIAAIRAFHS